MVSKLQENIRTFFQTVDDEHPMVVQIIANSLLGYERTARELHDEIHDGLFMECRKDPCRANSQTLTSTYRDIIALRRMEAATVSKQ
jgi:hypothetical protein